MAVVSVGGPVTAEDYVRAGQAGVFAFVEAAAEAVAAVDV